MEVCVYMYTQTCNCTFKCTVRCTLLFIYILFRWWGKESNERWRGVGVWGDIYLQACLLTKYSDGGVVSWNYYRRYFLLLFSAVDLMLFFVVLFRCWPDAIFCCSFPLTFCSFPLTWCYFGLFFSADPMLFSVVLFRCWPDAIFCWPDAIFCYFPLLTWCYLLLFFSAVDLMLFSVVLFLCWPDAICCCSFPLLTWCYSICCCSFLLLTWCYLIPQIPEWFQGGCHGYSCRHRCSFEGSLHSTGSEVWRISTSCVITTPPCSIPSVCWQDGARCFPATGELL